MAGPKFKEGRTDSFFGSLVCEQTVPKDHFLVKLNEVVPRQRFTYKLVQYFLGLAVDEAPPDQSTCWSETWSRVCQCR